MKRILLILLVTIVSTSVYSQSWRFYRHEVFAGIGPSAFLGDLGGGKGVGTHGPKDLNFRSTRFATTMGYKYMIHPYFSVTGSINIGMVSGDDALSKEDIRFNRNLNFRSMIYEFSVMGEFYPWQERNYHAYRIRTVRGRKVRNFSPYLFAGVGFFLFNPKAKYEGNWVALQPLGTEGQGLPGMPDKYKRYSIAFPFGLGIKYSIDKHWSVGFQYGLRYTLTDYIDDVSGNYYHADEIADANGDVAGELSNRALNPEDGWFGVINYADGTSNYLQRGDPNNKDFYNFAIFTVHYRFRQGRKYVPKF